MKTDCTECGKEIEFEPEMCCSGRDCGCMGMPIYPPWCGECWEKYNNRSNKISDK